jgi:2-polyprenyl-3-methyl-5-hydroxy-6-metoxy-1,4-benzoquinol methylase
MTVQTPSTLRNLLAAEVDPAFALRAGLILDALEEERPARVLDVGCGRGFYLHLLAQLPYIREIQGIDANATYLELARRAADDPRVHVRQAVIEALPFPEGYFDFVICSEVLEHLQDDATGLREIHRILRPGGTLMVTVPDRNFPFLWDPVNWLLMRLFGTHIPKHIWWLAGIWADHERLYAPDDLRRVSESTGFIVKRLQTVVSHCLPFSHFLLYGVGKNLVERVGLSQFDRFNYSRRGLSHHVAAIFRWPTRFDHSWEQEPAVDIVARLRRDARSDA